MLCDLDQFENKVASFNTLIAKEKQDIDNVVMAFADSEVYTVADNGGSVGSYDYFLYPFKGMTMISHRLNAVLGKYLAKLVASGTEAIVTIDSDGIGIASFVAAELDLPLIVAKSFHYHQECVEFVQQAGYHQRPMYLPKVIAGKRVAIVDCMVSTGGTVKAMVAAMATMPGTIVTGVLCVNNKSNYGNQADLIAGVPYHYLIETSITAEKKVAAKLSKAFKTVFWQEIDRQFYILAEDSSAFSKISQLGYRVGSLIVDADTCEILSWGYRRGHLHGEQDALSMLKISYPDWEARRLTLYSTMEPCIYRNNVGHTPCAELIAQTPQIKWVVIGAKDSANKRIYGEGVKHLLASGKSIRVIESNEVFRADEPVRLETVVLS